MTFSQLVFFFSSLCLLVPHRLLAHVVQGLQRGQVRVAGGQLRHGPRQTTPVKEMIKIFTRFKYFTYYSIFPPRVGRHGVLQLGEEDRHALVGQVGGEEIRGGARLLQRLAALRMRTRVALGLE